MRRPEPNEKRLNKLFQSPSANKGHERLQISNIFRQTNFKMGNESK